MFNFIKSWISKVKTNTEFLDLKKAHMELGSENPTAMIAKENYLLEYLERFRRYANARVTKEGETNLDAIKDEWLRENIRFMPTLSDGKNLRDVILAMPVDECLYDEVFASWMQEVVKRNNEKPTYKYGEIKNTPYANTKDKWGDQSHGSKPI